MHKIPTLFKRDERRHQVIDEVTPGCEWVIAGEGAATRKLDGTCCRWHEGKLWRRFDAKEGRTPPEGFVPAQDADPVTGHWPGWIPVGDGPVDRWHREALALEKEPMIDGTYELIGPKINGNPERRGQHELIPHGHWFMTSAPRTYHDLKAWLVEHDDIEGLVWWHPDGRAAKIKGRDFGLKRSAA